MESDDFRLVFPATDQAGGDSEGKGRHESARNPDISDRIAQTVAKRYIEPALEQLFHPDSYGYRPGRLPSGGWGDPKGCWQSTGSWSLISTAFDEIDLVA